MFFKDGLRYFQSENVLPNDEELGWFRISSFNFNFPTHMSYSISVKVKIQTHGKLLLLKMKKDWLR